MRVRTIASLALVLVAVLAASACGGGSNESSGGGETGGSGAVGSGNTTLKLAADPNGGLSFDKTSLEADSGKVTIDFTNDSSTPHNVTIEGNGVNEAGPVVQNGTSEVTVDLQAGEYTFFCSVPGHREGGMVGKLTVK